MTNRQGWEVKNTFYVIHLGYAYTFQNALLKAMNWIVPMQGRESVLNMGIGRQKKLYTTPPVKHLASWLHTTQTANFFENTLHACS